MTDYVPVYPRHFLLQWGGTFFGTERWQMGLRLCDVGSTDADRINVATNLLDAETNCVKAWWGAAGCGANRAAILEYVKFNPIGTDGKYLGSTTIQKAVTPTVTPPALSPIGENMPPQLALVLSMRSQQRGPRGSHGHIYMPAQRYTMVSANSPYIDPAQVTTICTAFKAFINDINDTPGWDIFPHPVVGIVTKSSLPGEKSGKGGGPQEFNDVIDVRVGNLYDTHRSRRNQLKETYVTQTLS